MIRRLRTGRARQAGMSLAELLVGIAVASIFGAMLMSFLANGTSTASGLESQRRAFDAGQLTLRYFTRDVRRSVGPQDGISPVISANAREIELYSDLSIDSESTRPAGQHGPRPSRVRYYVTSAAANTPPYTLWRTVRPVIGVSAPFTWGPVGTPELLAENVVNNDIFLALGESVADPIAGQPLANPVNAALLDDIRTIRLRMLLSQRHVNTNRNLEITTDATIR